MISVKDLNECRHAILFNMKDSIYGKRENILEI